ncbi:MAG TPA: small multi-drug export protein [Candidatus Methanofastidiosa archaeon]|nr:small multi-drug export protein [Candidatus Methanofastidiosa archaeon]HPR41295.1 small multi-drug export protein [Candidatus Methanofastidiosa archaeon]
MIDIYILISFFFIHIGLGRKISIPYAIALGITDWNVLIFAFILDVLQIPLFMYIYTHTSNIAIIKRFKARIEGKSTKMEGSRILVWAKNLGKAGTLLLAAMPFQGGGMWSGVLLAYILKLENRQMYPLLSAGSLIGCSIMAFGTSFILSLF